jgi:Flp pilus assembly protein TadG
MASQWANPRIPIRRKNLRGNAIIESVFTFMPLFALMFMFVDISLAIYRWGTLQNAVREGTRYAVTFQTGSGLGQDASIKNVVQQYAQGIVKTTDSPATIYIDYYDPNAPTVPITVGGNIPGNIVEVKVKNIPLAFLAPLSGNLAAPFRTSAPVMLTVTSADLLGGFPVGVMNVAR